ncbi:MAG: competence/damage-inducible protein A [Anaerolineae bacterium]
MVWVEILSIGDEILQGDVLDSNSHWLSRGVARRGGRIRRITVLPDQLDVVADEIRAALMRANDLVITTGGLGPTADDRTLEAVSQALNEPLELDAEALELVQQRYADLAERGYVSQSELTESRRKMARIPRGSEPVPNPVGGAPACLVRTGSSLLISLPGVPEELKGIWRESLGPVLDPLFGSHGFAERALLVECSDESLMASTMSQVAEEYPDVYVKSRARAFGPGTQVMVTLSARAESEDAARGSVAAAIEVLKERFQKQGLPSKEIDPDAVA